MDTFSSLEKIIHPHKNNSFEIVNDLEDFFMSSLEASIDNVYLHEREIENLEKFVDICEASITNDSIDIDSVLTYIGDTNSICSFLNISEENFRNLDDDCITIMKDNLENLNLDVLLKNLNIDLEDDEIKTSYEKVSDSREYRKKMVTYMIHRMKKKYDNANVKNGRLPSERFVDTLTDDIHFKWRLWTIIAFLFLSPLGLIIIMVLTTKNQKSFKKLNELQSQITNKSWRETSVTYTGITFNEFKSMCKEVTDYLNTIQRVSKNITSSDKGRILSELNPRRSPRLTFRITEKGKFAGFNSLEKKRREYQKDSPLHMGGYNGRSFDEMYKTLANVNKKMKETTDVVMDNFEKGFIKNKNNLHPDTKINSRAVNTALRGLVMFYKSDLLPDTVKVAKKIAKVV